MNSDGSSGSGGGQDISKSASNDDSFPNWGRSFSPRVLVGGGGDLLVSASGLLIATAGGEAKSAFAFSVSDFNAVSIKSLNGGNSTGDSLDYTIEGNNTIVKFELTKVAYWNFDELKPVKPLLGYLGDVNGVIVGIGASISQANAGKVFFTIPFTASGRSATKPTVHLENGLKIYRGNFPAVFDSKGVNVAPQGATEIRIDPKTNQIVGVH